MATKAILRRLVGEHQFYRIFRVDSSVSDPPSGAGCSLRRLERLDLLGASRHKELAQLVNYAGEQAMCFVAEDQGEIVAACWYWFGETYQRRNFWPLRPREAKLVQVTSATNVRGRGIAVALIHFSTGQMLGSGFDALYARVWHSHVASRRAFEKAGWSEYAKVIEASPFGRRTRVVWWV